MTVRQRIEISPSPRPIPSCLQPIPEHSSQKAAIKGDLSRPEIQTRMDDMADARHLGIPLGEMRIRLLLDALQRCIGVITAPNLQCICHAVLMGRKLKANNVLCIYVQRSLHLFTNSC